MQGSASNWRGSWSDEVDLGLWLQSRGFPWAGCLLGLRSLHTSQGREGAPDFDPSEDLIRIEWSKNLHLAIDSRRGFCPPPWGPIVLIIFITVSLVLGRCRLDLYGVALYSIGAVPTLAGRYCTRGRRPDLCGTTLYSVSTVSIRFLRVDAILIWYYPDLCGTLLYLVNVARPLRNWHCLDLCAAALYSIGAVPTLAGRYCTPGRRPNLCGMALYSVGIVSIQFLRVDTIHIWYYPDLCGTLLYLVSVVRPLRNWHLPGVQTNMSSCILLWMRIVVGG